MLRVRVDPVALALLFLVTLFVADPALSPPVGAAGGEPQPGWPTVINFGTGWFGYRSFGNLTLTNTGSAPYTVTSVTTHSPEFSLFNPLPVTVHPGSTVDLHIWFERTTLGSLEVPFELHTDIPSSLPILLRGTTIPSGPGAHLHAETIDFGSLPLGETSGVKSVWVHSNGTGTVTVQSVSGTGPDVTVLTPLPFYVEEGDELAIRFRFQPTVAGPFSETVRIRTNEVPDSILTLTLTADVRLPPVVAVDPGTMDPVELALGATAAVPVTLGNLGPEWALTGSASVRIDSVRMAAIGPPQVSGPRQVRFDGEGHQWDLEPDGSVATGDAGAFAGALDWAVFPAADASILRDGGRTIQFGPTTVGTRDYTRSVHVPLSGAWIRYVDTVRNRTNSPMTVQFSIQNGAALGLAVVARTSSGGATLMPQVDDWAVLADEAGPAIGHVFAGPGAQRPSAAGFGSGPSVGVHYVHAVDLEPGASAAILHFALQAPDLAIGMARAEQLRMLGDGALAGLTALERSHIVNFAVPRAISIPPTSFPIDPLASLSTAIHYDAGATFGEETVYGSLRVATNDPVTPLAVVPLELRILGTPEVIGVAPGVQGLALAARFLPNPMSGRGVRLSYALPTAGDARFELFDVRGRSLAARTIVDAPAGPGSLDWSAGGAGVLVPGVYWTRLTHAGMSVITKGVVLE